MRKYKVGMIGHRGHYGYVTVALPELPEVEITAVSGGGKDSAEPLIAAAAEHGFFPEVYQDYRELLDSAHVDVVCIDGPFELHAEMCVAALNRGIHVFCEKPIALTLDELERVKQAYAGSRAEIISMVGLRGEAAFLTAYDAVSHGAVGKVEMVTARKSYKLGVRPEFYRHRASYGGTIPWVGSHAIDWIYWFGGAEFQTVSAVHSRSGNRNHGDLESSALCMFTLKNGVLAGASIDYLRPSGAPTHGDDRVRAAGSDGVIEVTDSRVKLIDADGERELPLLPGCNIFTNFIHQLRHAGGPALVNAHDTFVLTEACLRARDAADRAERGE